MDTADGWLLARGILTGKWVGKVILYADNFIRTRLRLVSEIDLTVNRVWSNGRYVSRSFLNAWCFWICKQCGAWGRIWKEVTARQLVASTLHVWEVLGLVIGRCHFCAQGGAAPVEESALSVLCLSSAHTPLQKQSVSQRCHLLCTTVTTLTLPFDSTLSTPT